MTTRLVAVHGATGTQGSHIADRLRAAGYDVRPLRSNSVDLTDVESVSQAYADVDAVVVQLPLVFDPAAVRFAETIIAALGKAKVGRAVFNPGMPLPPVPVGAPYVDARVSIATQLPTVVEVASVLGPAGPYLENFLQPWSVRRIRDAGELAYPVPGQIPMPWLTLDDLGDAVAAALGQASPAPVSALAGPQALTGDLVAAAVAAGAGREVRWVHISPAEYRELLTPVIGPAAAAGIAGVYEQAGPAPVPPAQIVRQTSTTVRQWAARQDWN